VREGLSQAISPLVLHTYKRLLRAIYTPQISLSKHSGSQLPLNGLFTIFYHSFILTRRLFTAAQNPILIASISIFSGTLRSNCYSKCGTAGLLALSCLWYCRCSPSLILLLGACAGQKGTDTQSFSIPVDSDRNTLL
jgi:hypothetical protein